MPSSVFGLPTHILVLHVVIVLLPIAAVAAIVVVASARFRHRYGLLVLSATFVTTLFVPLTSQSGESLAARLPRTASILRHAAIGQQLVIWTAAFGLCLAGAVAVDLLRRLAGPADALAPAESWVAARVPSLARDEAPAWASTAFRIFQILVVVLAIVCVFIVIRAGHSGAQAVWSNYPGLKPG